MSSPLRSPAPAAEKKTAAPPPSQSPPPLPPPQSSLPPPNSTNNKSTQTPDPEATQETTVPSPRLSPLRLAAASSVGSPRLPPPSLASLPLSSPTPSDKKNQWPPPPAAATKPPAFDPAEEAINSPLRSPSLAAVSDKPARSPAIANRLGVQPRPSLSEAENGRGRELPAMAVRRLEGTMASVALRLVAAAMCLVSFSVMASDSTTGWEGDHYGRYEEYRYSVGVNVIAFFYSGFQFCVEVYRMATRRFILRGMSSYYFDLAMDQTLAYLLMSASSAAASRNEVWVSSFGGDAFTKKINGSVWMSFLAFMSLAASSIISASSVFSSLS